MRTRDRFKNILLAFAFAAVGAVGAGWVAAECSDTIAAMVLGAGRRPLRLRSGPLLRPAAGRAWVRAEMEAGAEVAPPRAGHERPAEDLALLALHRRLLAGSGEADEQLAGRLIPKLLASLSRSFPRADRPLISDGVTDAVLEYLRRPLRFAADRGVPLGRYLARAAWCNVRDLLRADQRRRDREARLAQEAVEKAVALEPSVANIEWNDESFANLEFAAQLGLFDNPTDRRMLALWLQGERRTQEYAKAMGLSGLSDAAARRVVKRNKDRLRKRFQRWATPATRRRASERAQQVR